MQQSDTATVVTFPDAVAFLRAHLEKCEHQSGSGLVPDFPDFELMPHDYLDYANEALANPTDANRINCIGHLKRAAECEADTFLHILNLGDRAKKMSFPQKLEAIEAFDLMPSRSVAQLNRIRNKMEHEYTSPKVDDLALYFDLVAGFVAAVEGAIFMLASTAEMDWHSDDTSTGTTPQFSIGFNAKEPSVHFAMFDGISHTRFSVQPDEWNTFLAAMRVVFLLIRGAYIVSQDHVLQRLPKAEAT